MGFDDAVGMYRSLQSVTQPAALHVAEVYKYGLCFEPSRC